jgi:autotransporter-associated beta strand protein
MDPGTNGSIILSDKINFVISSNSTTGSGIVSRTGTNEIKGKITMQSGLSSTAISSAAGSTLTLSGVISANAATRTLYLGGVSTNANTVSGDMNNSAGQGNFNVQKNDAGTWILTGNNSYTGSTLVSAGVLNVRHANALGTTAGTTTVNDAATLQLQGGVSFAAETLSLTGNGVSSAGSLRSISGNNTWNGAINAGVAAATRVQSDADKLTLAGTITLSTTAGDQFVLQGDGAIDVTGKVTGASILTSSSNGTGIRTLSNAANDYAGETRVNGGFLQAGVTNALPYGAGKGNLVLNGGSSAVGVFNLNGYDININGLAGTTGAFVGQVVNNANGTTKTLTVGNGNATASFAGVLADNNSGTGILAFEKTGSGTQTLSGTNTYSGNTTVTNGRLNINGSITSDTAVAAIASLGGDGTITGDVSLAGTLLPGQGGITDRGLTINGNVTTSAGSKIAFTVTNMGAANHDQLVIGAGSSIGLNNADLEVTFDPLLTFSILGAGQGDEFLAAVSGGGSYTGTGSWFRLISGSTDGMFDNVTDTMSPTELSYFGLTGTQYKKNLGGQDFWIAQGSTYLVAIPEPRAALLGGIGMLMLLCRRRVA